MNQRICAILSALFICILLCTGTVNASEQKNTKSDTWLEAQLVTSYTLNRHLNPFRIDVDVTDGVATLTGTVDNDVERDLAVEIAKGVNGINKVNEKLIVDPSGSAKKEKSEFARRVDDATLTAKVKYRLIFNKNISAYDIDVDTENSTVTLTGKVDSAEKRDLAVKLAENTTGVRKVKDNLRIVTTADLQKGSSTGSMDKKMKDLATDINDTWITAKAKGLLAVSDEAEGARYDISTDNGTITLIGTALSNKQAKAIQSILEDLQGVKNVDNQLTVR